MHSTRDLSRSHFDKIVNRTTDWHQSHVNFSQKNITTDNSNSNVPLIATFDLAAVLSEVAAFLSTIFTDEEGPGLIMTEIALRTDTNVERHQEKVVPTIQF